MMSLKKRFNSKGFSLVEVVVASVVFAISAAGTIAMISSLNKPAHETSDAVTASLVGKQILEEFRKEVDMATWDEVDGKLAVGDHTLADIVIDGQTYTPTYTVVEDASTRARRVDLHVDW